MKVSVYRLINHNNRYLLVKEETDPTKVLDAGTISEIGPVVFQKYIDLELGQKRIALDSDEAIQNILKNGYHLSEVKITVKVGIE